MSVTAYIGLGSNVGDREGHLRQALKQVGETPGIQIQSFSSFRETSPIGGPAGQEPYLNAAAQLAVTLSASDLLKALLDIERRLGRIRGVLHGPRTIDLDLLLYGTEVGRWTDGVDLQLPHPRLHERLFVLEPLAEIAPGAEHPVLRQTISQLRARLKGESSRDLAGLRAVVTGSSSGIGRAIALELAAAGADVLVHARRSAERARETVSLCQQHGVRADVVPADLADEAGLAMFADSAWGLWGGVDIWINNAGADTLTGAAARWPFERKLAELWAVDVRATMILSRNIGKRMKERGRGAIVNIGWDQADTGMEGDSGELFAATKGAVMAFSRSLALSLAPEVRVNCIAPGWIRTAWGEQASSAWQDRVLRETPLRRWGTPLDIASAARWLVAPTSAYITGQVIRVNGGAVR